MRKHYQELNSLQPVAENKCGKDSKWFTNSGHLIIFSSKQSQKIQRSSEFSYKVLALMCPVCSKLRQGLYYEIGAEQENKVSNMVIDWQSDQDLSPGPFGWLPSTITNELNSHRQYIGRLNSLLQSVNQITPKYTAILFSSIMDLILLSRKFPPG